MRSSAVRSLCGGILLALVVQPLCAQTLIIDEGTQVGFETSLFGLFTLSGIFTQVEGTIDLAGSAIGDETVRVTLDAASIKTDRERIDTLLRGPDFFDAARHPDIVFRSTAVAVVAEGRLTIDGNLTLRGVTKPLRLQATYEPVHASDDHTTAIASIIAVGRLSRRSFGMTAYPAMVGDTVTITIAARDLVPR